MYVCVPCVCLAPMEGRRGFRSLGTGVTDDGVWALGTVGPLEEWQLLLSTERISSLSTLFCKLVFHTRPGLAHLATMTVLWAWGSSFLCLPRTGITNAYRHIWLFTLVLEIKQVCLYGKHFTEPSLQSQLNYVDILKYFKGEYIYVFLLMRRGVIHSTFQKGTFASISCRYFCSQKVRWQWQPLVPHMETFPEMIRHAKKDVWNWKNLQCNHSIGKENHTSLFLWAKSVFQERNIPNPIQKTFCFIKMEKVFRRH